MYRALNQSSKQEFTAKRFISSYREAEAVATQRSLLPGSPNGSSSSGCDPDRLGAGDGQNDRLRPGRRGTSSCPQPKGESPGIRLWSSQACAAESIWRTESNWPRGRRSSPPTAPRWRRGRPPLAPTRWAAPRSTSPAKSEPPKPRSYQRSPALASPPIPRSG